MKGDRFAVPLPDRTGRGLASRLAIQVRSGLLTGMGKLVLMHKADSIYEDEPDVVYDFPRSYLKAVQEAVGDWIV